MRIMHPLAAASLLVSLAACAPETQAPSAPAMSSNAHSSQGMPQPAGSLPPGDVVNAPVMNGGGAGSVTTTNAPVRRSY